MSQSLAAARTTAGPAAQLVLAGDLEPPLHRAAPARRAHGRPSRLRGSGFGFDEVWSLVAACEPSVPLHGGAGSPVAGPEGLAGALAEARYALISAQSIASAASLLTAATAFTGLDTLLTGVPAEVRAAYGRTVLGSLIDAGNARLLHTLRTFLACDGSWARTAQALHLHVNTVHYRIQRIEYFTGRYLSRLADRLDL